MSDLKNSRLERPHFDGLWLCPETSPDDQGDVISSALLFAQARDQFFMIRFNHSGGEGGVTIPFMWDYQVLPGIIREHPLNYPAKTRFDIPWQIGQGGSLTLHFRRGATRFFPAQWKDLFALGFERDEIALVLADIEEAGWIYVLVPRFPEFPKSRQ